MITFRHEWQNSDKDPDIEQYMPPQTVVPVVAARSGKWTATEWVVHADGQLRAVDVSQNSYIERWIPGVIEGHLYKVTIAADTAEANFIITMGGVTLATALTDGTIVVYVRPVDGSPLRFESTGVPIFSADITSVIVEAHDPINLNLIPPVQVFSA